MSNQCTCLANIFYPQLPTHLTRSAFRFGVEYDSPKAKCGQGYTRSTWAGRFMIGLSTVIINQQGERVFKHCTPFCSIACFTTA